MCFSLKQKRHTYDVHRKASPTNTQRKHIALYLAFLDITKAHNSANRETMLQILQIIGFLTKMLSIFKMLYGESNRKIRWNGKCYAICLFFNNFFAVVLHEINQKLTNRGIQLCFRLDSSIFDISRL